MDDLVKRLRIWDSSNHLMREAADEIERLRNELATVTRERDEFNTARLAVIADRDRIWDERHKAEQERDELKATCRDHAEIQNALHEQLAAAQQAERDISVHCVTLQKAVGEWKESALNGGNAGYLREQLAACQKDAYDLWMMLDNIDTADDIAKADEKLYRSMVRREHAKRFDDRFKWVMNHIDAAMKEQTT